MQETTKAVEIEQLNGVIESLKLEMEHMKEQHAVEVDQLKQEIHMYTKKLKSSSEKQLAVESMISNFSIELEALQAANKAVWRPYLDFTYIHN